VDNALPFAHETLIRLLTEQGLNARLWQESFVAGIGEIWGRINEAEVLERSDQFMASLHIEVYTDRNKTYTVSDNVAGFSRTAEGALRMAVSRYIHGTLLAFRALNDPAIVAADVPPMGLETTSPRTNRVTKWKIHSGEWLTTGPADSVLRAALVERPPLSLLRDEVLARLVAEDDRMHWVKLLLVRRADGAVFTECAIDSQENASGKKKLTGFVGWPEAAEMQSIRQFALIQPQEQKERGPVVQAAQQRSSTSSPSLRPIGGR
jgi:hypothetical protein